jgi:putative cardiolipin synthase
MRSLLAKSKLALAFILLLGLGGCLHADAAVKTASQALPQKTETSLSRLIAPAVRAHPEKSGFALLWEGRQSLLTRLGLIRAAERTLDLQYYIISDDATSNLLLETILRAAERGVRVRFIVDSLALDEVKHSLAALDGAKNIEIRVFNPPDASGPPLFGLLAMIGRATKRMHQKTLIADNQIAITGGRNLGDAYFDADPGVNYHDLDVLAAGPVVARMSKSFDDFWSSARTVPLGAMPRHAPSNIREELKKGWTATLEKPGGRELLESLFAARLEKGEVKLTWARGELASDTPGKIEQPREEAESKTLAHMAALAGQGQREFIAITPYFVPQKAGVDWLVGLVKRGMRVRVLTNSLSSTDVVAVHAGYHRYRRALVEGGVELYEAKAAGGKRPRQRLAGSTAAQASLHMKAYVIDRRDAIVGSFNLDPRSVELNTEMSLVMHSAALAREIVAQFEEWTKPANSYRVKVLDGKMVWFTEEKGEHGYFDADPRAGVRKFQSFLMSLLPFEGQL